MARAQYWSLTEHLLSLVPEEYKSATQSPFLLAAGQGTLPKETLSKWLANDRLYIHAYVKAAGQLLHSIDLPQHVPEQEAVETQLVDWLIDALAAVRKEERLFIDVAERYGLGLDLVTPVVGTKALESGTSKPAVAEDAKLPGLVAIEKIFASVAPPPRAPGSFSASSSAASTNNPTLLPWLEGAVVFWGTERCYLDAWSWARSKQGLAHASGKKEEDADGGALRKEFIPNWSSSEFATFVGKLAGIVDMAVSEALMKAGEGAREEIVARVETKWKTLLAAEATFWPAVE
jgi:thiaminase